ncbi:MAG: UDP-N-acetylglucosamine--N-acetylmuramyl-(pentapeptide) pyrophosphoryl-undecaprenol N-acetylglucosamine transferase [Candidatus Aureabacteria bacterium]|nr:UDP-N-acetylglucosamine--N-acetylmuramyl-(pentapeptide) pyrophosphoryl-undecaprenol N-acetylglucosamine transferase [Candidatus Auribacterota bacterium]
MNGRDTKHFIIISCGGTGGHLAPGIAVGEQLAQRGLGVIYLINDKAVASHFMATPGYEFRALPEIKYRKIWSICAWSVLAEMLKSIQGILKLYFGYRIVHVLSAGGGAGILPVLIYRLLGVPVSLLEQNAVMGQANRFLMKFARKVYLTFPCVNVGASPKMKLTGNPVRGSLDSPVLSKKEACQRLNLKEDRFTFLIMGGSQGAKRLNEFALAIMEKMTGIIKQGQVIHLVGKYLLEECRNLYRKLNIPFYCEEFCQDMLPVYTLADFAISRAGGGGIAELLIFNIPSVFVPFPYATEEHQHVNAQWVEKNGCGWMMEEKELFSEAGTERLSGLLNDSVAQLECKKRQKQHARPGAAREVAEGILEEVDKRGMQG